MLSGRFSHVVISTLGGDKVCSYLTVEKVKAQRGKGTFQVTRPLLLFISWPWLVLSVPEPGCLFSSLPAPSSLSPFPQPGCPGVGLEDGMTVARL